MVDKQYKPMRLPSELEQPQLSTDLDWILTSSQSSVPLVVELLVNELYPSMYRLARVLLNYDRQADDAVQETLVRVILRRHPYRSQMGVTGWVFKLLFEVCQSKLKSQRTLDGVAHPPAEMGQGSWLGERVREESTLREALGESSYKTRGILALHFLFDLPAKEISLILGEPESEISTALENSRRWMLLFRPSGIAEGEAAEEWGRAALGQCWPPSHPTELERQSWVAAVQARLKRRSRRIQVITIFQQSLFVLAAVTVILIAGWASSHLYRKNPQKSQTGTGSTPGAPTTQNQVSALPTRAEPTLGPTEFFLRHRPLTVLSAPEEIRRRMYESRTLWDSVWVDALIIRYSQPGSIGSLPVYRSQMWISNPNQVGRSEERLVLSGLRDGKPEYAMMIQRGNVSEVDLPANVTYNYPLGDTNPFYDNFNPAYLGIYGFDDRGLRDGSFLASMLFAVGPITNLAQLRVVSMDHMLGREVLVVASMQPGTNLELMYIDTQTGMILRWMGFGGKDMQDVLAEIVVNQLKFEPVFSAEDRFASLYSIHPTEWLTVGDQGIRMPKTTVTPEDNPGQAFQHIPPPPQLNPALSCLTFHWGAGSQGATVPNQVDTGKSGPGVVLLSQPAVVPSDSVDLFADRYYLGSVSLGDPRYMKCKRSNNGELVGCLSPPPGLERAVFAGSNLYWFRLTNLGDVNNAFPDATWISSDFSFSPDGTTLAFWGCKDNRERCAVFLEDTQSKDVSVLVTLKNGASYFKWSPDGNYLSFIVNNPSSPTTPEFTVVNVPGGEIVSQDSIRNKNLLDGANPMNPYQGVSPDMAGAGLGQCIQVQD